MAWSFQFILPACLLIPLHTENSNTTGSFQDKANKHLSFLIHETQAWKPAKVCDQVARQTRNTGKWKMPKGMYYTSTSIDNIPMHFAAGTCFVAVISIPVKSTQLEEKCLWPPLILITFYKLAGSHEEFYFLVSINCRHSILKF